MNASGNSDPSLPGYPWRSEGERLAVPERRAAAESETGTTEDVDHDPVKQVLLSPEGMLTPQAAAEIEATIALLREHFERVRQHEVKRLRGHLGELSSTQENAIESLTHAIIDQILHAPITALKAASQDNESPAVIEIVHHVFSLGAGVERPEYDQAFGRPIE